MMKKLISKNKLIILFVLVVNSFSVFAQGGCNIKYIPIDLLNTNLISKEIRLDFKSTDLDVIKETPNIFEIRRLLSTKDTITINVGKKNIAFIENWELRVDECILSKQTLNGVCRKNKKQIREVFLVSYDDKSLVLKIRLYKQNKSNSKTATKYKEETVSVLKSKIKGVITLVD